MASPRQLQFSLMLRGISEGFSGNQLLDLFREFGLGMRRSDFFHLFGQARTVVAEAGAEPSRPLDQVPTLAESAPVAAMQTAEPGVIQTVRLIYRERVTGNLRTVYHSVKTPGGITRGQAVNQAISAYQPHSEEYETDLLAAAHTSAIRIVPGELAA